MRTRFLLPALLLALLPLPAHAAADRGSGIECSIQDVSISPDAGEPYTAPVGALWVLTNRNIARMTLHCEVWVGDASFQAHEPPVQTYDASSDGVPFVSMATVSSFSDTAELIWCMTATAYDASDYVVDKHDRCYIQTAGPA